jgi:hypothetical protein
MKRQILLDGRFLDYDLKPNARSRRVSIVVHPGPEVVVTIPARGSVVSAERFIRLQANWIFRQIEKLEKLPTPKYSPGGTKVDYEKRKAEARRFVRERLKYFNEFYRFDYGRVSIRNQKTRWGSCSVDGNLNFNYKLVAIPIRMADYIIVHELCHLSEFNHSRRFWSLVERAIPEYREIRKQLRGYGGELE